MHVTYVHGTFMFECGVIAREIFVFSCKVSTRNDLNIHTTVYYRGILNVQTHDIRVYLHPRKMYGT